MAVQTDSKTVQVVTVLIPSGSNAGCGASLVTNMSAVLHGIGKL